MSTGKHQPENTASGSFVQVSKKCRASTISLKADSARRTLQTRQRRPTLRTKFKKIELKLSRTGIKDMGGGNGPDKNKRTKPESLTHCNKTEKKEAKTQVVRELS